jgi:hypothetical protein
MRYIGQTRRRFERREKEHEEAAKQKMLNKSAVALHCFEKKHQKGQGEIIKEISNPLILDAWESLYLSSKDNLMNVGEAPIKSSLFKYAQGTTSH